MEYWGAMKNEQKNIAKTIIRVVSNIVDDNGLHA